MSTGAAALLSPALAGFDGLSVGAGAAARAAQLDEETARLLEELFEGGPLPSDLQADFRALPQTAAEKAIADRDDQLGIWIDGIEPPPLDRFCEMLDGYGLFPRQLRAFAGPNMLSPYRLLAQRDLHQWVLVWGKGSGKDYLVAKFMAWVFLILCSLREDPAAYFGIARQSRLSIINVAATKEQARNVFFSQYLARFLKHKMFDRFLRAGNGAAAFGKKDEASGKETSDRIIHYRVDPTTGVRYECIGIYSMHSRAASLEGHNVFAWVMDEADAFLDNAERSNGQEVYDTLRSSSQRFQRYWVGLIISYPRVEEGFLMRLRGKALDEIAKAAGTDREAPYVTDMAPSWEVNPLFNREDPDVVEMFETDFRRANAVYGCVPMAAEDGFFEFVEKLYENTLAEAAASPCCIITTETLDVPLAAGGMAYYVRGVVGAVNRVPGYTYILAGDAAGKKDSYALSVWHYDSAPAAFPWLCPDCGADPVLRAAAEYVKQDHGARVPATEVIMCPICSITPAEYAGGWTQGTVGVKGWYKRSDRDESAVEIGGKRYNVRRMQEDLIVAIEPRRATSSDPNHESGRNRLVHFPSMSEMIEEVIVRLGVAHARFDPWQTYEVTQKLQQTTGGDIDEISFSNPEQYRRAKWFKAMMYGGLLTFLPHPKRDREIKRLQRKGDYGIDHPKGAGESKDLFDVESMCVWTGAVAQDAQISATFF